MNSTSVATTEAAAADRWKSISLVFVCTLLGAAAQMLIKTGANTISHKDWLASLLGMVTSMPLFFGYAMYGLSLILLTLAFRHGELSKLYPVIALTYVWVAALSVLILHEPMNTFKGIGVALIVAGVGIMGLGGKR